MKQTRYKNITFCCQNCGTKISWASALYGNGNCKSCAKKGKNNTFFGKHHSKKSKLKISIAHRGKNHPFFGKKRPKHSKQMTGDNNPMFGIHRFGKNAPNFGKKHSKESKLKMSKARKGKKLSKEHCLKMSKALKGKNHYLFGKHVPKEIRLKISKTLKGKYKGKKNPRYINGQGNAPYPIMFNDVLKLKIRKRDNFTCQHCNLKEKNHFRANKQINLTVHHIDYNKQNCKESNLIALCNNCNTVANSNRDYWFAYYIYIMQHFVSKNG